MDIMKSNFLVFGGLFFSSLLLHAATPPGETPIPAPPFIPVDEIISDPAVSMLDPEIDVVNNRVAWRDKSGKLWLADINPKTAEMSPVSGQGTLLDTGLAGLAGLKGVLQGPEWGYGTDSTEIIYTKHIGGGVYHLGAARETPEGTWVTRLLNGGENRYTPYASPSWYDQGPSRAVYFGLDSSGEEFLWWRKIKYPGSEVKVFQQSARHPSFIEGEDALLLTTVKSGESIRQVARLPLTNPPTSAPVQLTTDAMNKKYPAMLYAPDFGEKIIVTLVGFNDIGVYHEVGGEWVQLRQFKIPSALPVYSALRTFTYNNKSYIVVIAAESGGQIGTPAPSLSEVWIAGLDPSEAFFRQISDPSKLEIRKDPEVYFTRSGPVILYSEKNADTGRWLWRRAQTGLHPEYGYDHPAYGGAWSVIHRDNKNCDCAPFPIADQYVEDHRTILPHAQMVRLTIGPEGNTYFPFFDLSGDPDLPKERGYIGYDTYKSGEQVLRLTEQDITTRFTAGNNLIGADGDFFLAGNEAMNKFTPDGVRLWQTPIKGVPTSAQFAPDGQVVFFSWNGWAYIVDPETGVKNLEKEMSPGRVFPPDPSCLVLGNDPGCAYANTPAVDPFKNVIYNTYTDENGLGALHAYTYQTDPYDISLSWKNETLTGGSASSPVLSADYTRLYVHDQESGLYAIDAITGQTIWYFDLGYRANASPNVNDNGYIIPGGSQTDPVNYSSIRIIKDRGEHADWVFEDTNYRPVSAAAAGLDDRWVIFGRDILDETKLYLLVVHPVEGVISTTPWIDGPDPTRLTGIAIREDGFLVVNVWGKTGYKAFAPVKTP